jgi:large subunit ribosomal protein L22
MEARAYLRGLRISPRKVQIVLDLIRNKPADVALATLRHTPKAASEPVMKLLKSAMANAENNHSMDKKHLMYRNVLPPAPHEAHHARHRAEPFRILKRSCHINIVVKDKSESKEVNRFGQQSKSPRSSRRRDQGLGFPLVCQGQRLRRHPC